MCSVCAVQRVRSVCAVQRVRSAACAQCSVYAACAQCSVCAACVDFTPRDVCCVTHGIYRSVQENMQERE